MLILSFFVDSWAFEMIPEFKIFPNLQDYPHHGANPVNPA